MPPDHEKIDLHAACSGSEFLDREKKAFYEKHGVREYILVDPFENYIERFVLNDGRYGVPEIFGPGEVLVLNSLEGLEVELGEVFETNG
jgi:Uma2 family endonuclease